VMIILFYRRGIMGSKEFSWKWLLSKLQAVFKSKTTEQEK